MYHTLFEDWIGGYAFGLVVGVYLTLVVQSVRRKP